jgi:uncharacterized membrane protein YgcG
MVEATAAGAADALEHPSAGMARWLRHAVGVVAGVVVVAGLALGLVTVRAASPVSRRHRSAMPAVVPTTAAPTGARCPLADEPAPGGTVPDRPAVAIKVGNDPGAWPQSGLGRADVVFEEPIEGAITRLLAVFQCYGSTQVGPVRSTRWIDVQLLPQFGHPVFGFAGGIDPDRTLVADSPVIDADFFRDYDLYYRSADRVAPENLYVSTASLWGVTSSHQPPSPIFTFSSSVPAAEHPQSVTAATLTWSSIYDVTWTWDPQAGQWLRAMNGQPATDTSGNQLQAANVVIVRVHTVAGPYVEDSEGDHGVHSITIGHGALTVLRDGQAITGTWYRSSTRRPFTLEDRAGATIPLAPGPTWVELLPVQGHQQLATGSSGGTGSSGSGSSGGQGSSGSG